MELDGRDFDGRLQDIVKCNDVGIFKVQDQHVGIKRYSKKVDAILVWFKVFNEGNRDQVLLGWVEPNARNGLRLAVLLFEVGSGDYVDVGVLWAWRGIFISEHLKVVLKHIDDFVGLESLFDAILHTVDKLIELFVQVTTS